MDREELKRQLAEVLSKYLLNHTLEDLGGEIAYHAGMVGAVTLLNSLESQTKTTK